MSAAEQSLDLQFDVARSLVGGSVDSLEPVGGGRNSRVYHLRSGGRDFALKQYPSRADDPRDRLGTEVKALELMELNRFDAVPRILAADPERGYALLSWLEGSPVREVAARDIDQAVAFLAAVHGLCGAQSLSHTFSHERLASEACLSGHEIQRQIEVRLAQLRRAPAAQGELCSFLDGPFEAAFDRLVSRARTWSSRANLDFAGELPQGKRSLAASDFGFHNSLRRPDGSLVFFDFEYFGWDDPVKLTADVMLHPGTPVAVPLVRRFRRAAEELYGDDAGFQNRLNAFYPLFGLRWVLILLNEFLPERWQRRVLAGAAESWDEAKRRQLAQARALLAHIEEPDGGREIGR